MNSQVPPGAAPREPAVIERPPVTENPFQRAMSPHANAGAVEIESSRAVAEAQGKLVIAKRFPRDPFNAMQRLLDACRRVSLAESALYEYSRSGSKVRGPSIRLAEEIARCWGNIEYGLRELSNRDGMSEMEAYAWDLETNTYSSQRFTVRHVRDTQRGSYDLKDQRDVYEMTANLGARRMRARILAIIPDDVVEAAVQQCEQTIKHGGGESLVDRLNALVTAFAELGVNVGHLERRLGHPIGNTLPEEIVHLKGVYRSLRDGQSKPSDWFGEGVEAKAPPPERPAPPTYTDEKFAELLPQWRSVVQSGRKTVPELISMISTRGQLTSEQRAQIEALEEPDPDGPIPGLDG